MRLACTASDHYSRSVRRSCIHPRSQGTIFKLVPIYKTYKHSNLQIEIKATPSGGIINSGRKSKKVTSHIDNSYKSFALPPKIPYEPTIKDKMCFKAVTFMKVLFINIDYLQMYVMHYVMLFLFIGISTVFFRRAAPMQPNSNSCV